MIIDELVNPRSNIRKFTNIIYRNLPENFRVIYRGDIRASLIRGLSDMIESVFYGIKSQSDPAFHVKADEQLIS